jgi:multiple sugar transport system substrate-binding protein
METLKGMTWDHPRGLDSLVNSNSILLEECGVSVDWDARSLLAFGDQPVVEFYEDYDLMVIDHPHVPDAVHSETVIPFDELLTTEQMAELAKTSMGQSHPSYTYRGKQWALAVDTAAQVTAYRPDRAASAPQLWSDVIAEARLGNVLWAQKPVDAFSTFATLMAQKGFGLAGNSEFINRDAATEVLEFMVELSTLVPEFCLEKNPIEISELLAGDSDFTFGVCMYGYSNYSREGFRRNLLLYTDVPSFDGKATGSQLGGAGIAISQASKNPVLAAEIAYLLSSPKIQATSYVEAGGQPGNLLAWQSPYANLMTNNFFTNTIRTLEEAWVRPRLYGWPEIQYAASQIIHRVLVKKSVTTSDISQIASTYEKYLKE